MLVSSVSPKTSVNNYKSNNVRKSQKPFYNQSSQPSFTGIKSNFALILKGLFSSKPNTVIETLVNHVLLSKNNFDVEAFDKIFDALLSRQVGKKSQKAAEKMLSNLGEKFGNDEGIVKVAFSKINPIETAYGAKKLLKAGFNPYIINSVFDFPVISFLESKGKQSLVNMLNHIEIFKHLPVEAKEDSSLASAVFYHFNPFLNNNGFMTKVRRSNLSETDGRLTLLQERDTILKRMPDNQFKNSINSLITNLVEITSPSGYSPPYSKLHFLGLSVRRALTNELISPKTFLDLSWINRYVELKSNESTYVYLLKKYLNDDGKVDKKYFETLHDTLVSNDYFKSYDIDNKDDMMHAIMSLNPNRDLSSLDKCKSDINDFNYAVQIFLQNDLRRTRFKTLSEGMMDKITKLAYIKEDGFDFGLSSDKKAYLIRESLNNIGSNSFRRITKLEYYLKIVQKSQELQAKDKTLLPDLESAIKKYKDLPQTLYTNDFAKDKYLENNPYLFKF